MRSRLFLALVAMLVLSAPACARGGDTLDRLLPDLRAAHPGRLSDAEPYTDAGGRTRYHIKWMTPDGRILYFDGDPSTGRFSRGGNDWRGQRYAPRERDDDFDGGDDRGPAGPRSRFSGDDGPWDSGGDWRERRGRGPEGGWRRVPDRGMAFPGGEGFHGERGGPRGGEGGWHGRPMRGGTGAWGGPGFWRGGGHWGGGGRGRHGH